LMRLAIGFSLAENRIMSSGASVDGRGPQRGCAARPASARPGMGTAEPHAGAALAGATPRPGLVRPAWLPNHVRGLDTLRGLAILLVLLFHCQRRLGPLHLSGIAAWGWSGVNLFFVLSGFLITGIVLDARPRGRFFAGFYARRGLRILPVYILVVPINYWIFGRANTWSRPGAVWPYFTFFVQNLVPGLTGTIEPTWSLAIEEQFY